MNEVNYRRMKEVKTTYFLHLFSFLSLFAFAFAFGLRLPAHAALPDAYVETTGTQYFITDVKAGCKLKIVLDFMNRGDNIEADKQQRFFGVDGDSTIVFSLSAYHNGNNNLSYAAQDGQGNWTATGWTLDKTTRRTFTVDPYGNKWDLRNSGASSATHSGAMNTTRTKTGGAYLAIAADNKQTPPNMPGEMRLYSFKAYEYGKLIRCYVPYWDNTKTGLVEFVNGTFLTNCWLSGAAPLLVGGTPTTDYNAYLADSDGARWSTTDSRLEWKVAAAASDAAGGTVSADGGTAASSVTGWAPTGGSVTLTAAAASGWVFIGWQGDTSGFTASELRQTSLTVPVTGPRSLTARFVEISTTNLTAYDYSRDGLIAQWDAVENAGYGYHLSSPGTWAELVSGVTVTHVGSPTYNASNVVFNGNQYFYATVPSVLAALSAKDMTVQLFLRPTEYTSGAGYFHLGSSTANRQLVLDMRQETGTASAYGAFSGLQYASDGWYDATHVCIPVSTTSYFGKDTLATVRVDADGAKIAFDGGANVHTNTGKGVAPTSPLVNIGWYYGCSKAKFTLYSARFYSHALTEDEVRYNFELDRARFVYPNRIRRSGTAFAYLCRATVEGGGGGTVSVNDGTAGTSVDGWFAAHSSVTVRATPDEGKVFLCWKGDVSGLTDEQVASAELTFAGDEPRNLTAVFSAPTTALTSLAYVQQGLVAHWDGLENVARGQHGATSTVWKDLAGSRNLTLNTTYGSFSPTSLVCKCNGNGYAAGGAAACTTYLTGEFRLDPTTASAAYVFNSGDDANTRCLTLYNGNLFLVKTGDGKWCSGGRSTLAATYSGSTVSGHYTNGVATTASDSDTWGGRGTKISVGCGYSSYTYPYAGNVYAIRLYSRALTASELAWNTMIDRHRFDGAALDESISTDFQRFSDGELQLKIAASASGEGLVRIGDGTAAASASVWTAFGSSVTLTAEKGTGTFVQWTGDVEGLDAEDLRKATLTVDVSRARSLVAMFTESSTGIPARVYVQDGLVSLFDAIENAGVGQRCGDVTANGWVDHASGCVLTANVASDGAVTTLADGIGLTKAALRAYDVGGPATVLGNALGAETKTVEIAGREDSYKKYYHWLWALMADTETSSDYARRIFLWYDSDSSIHGCLCLYNQKYNEAIPFDTKVKANFTHTLTFGAAASYSFYTNGFVKGSASSSGATAVTTKQAGIVLRGGTYAGSPCSIANNTIYRALRIYNRQLTPAEVARNAGFDRLRFDGATSNETGCAWADGAAKCRLTLSLGDGTEGGVSFGADTPGASATGWFAIGSNVTVVATAPTGKVFIGWTGDTTSIPASQLLSSTAVIPVTGPLRLVPTFGTPAAKRWLGTSSSLASDGANWTGGVAPATGDAIVLDGADDNAQRAMTWDLNDVAPASWTQDGYTNVVTFKTGTVQNSGTRGFLSPDGEYRELRVTGDITLKTGTWTHYSNANVTYSSGMWGWSRSEGHFRLVSRVGGNFDLGENVKIDVSVRGYKEGQGPDGWNPGSGGMGSWYWGPGTDWKARGYIKQPRVTGGAWGGGSVELHVTGGAKVDGKIVANGQGATSCMGPGGSVWITAASLTGGTNAAITANGGVSGGGGGGGGGRISLQLKGAGEDFSNYKGSIRTAAYSMSYDGTVYLETADQDGKGELRVQGHYDTAGNTWYSDSLSHVYGGTPLATDDLDDSTFSLIRIWGNVKACVVAGTTCRVDRVVASGNKDYQWILLKGGTFQTAGDWMPTNCLLRVSRGHSGSVLRLGPDGDKTLIMTNSSSCVAYWDRAFTVEGNVHVKKSGLITHEPHFKYDCGSRLVPHITGNLTIDAGGSVSVGGQGYQAQYGPGAPTAEGKLSRGGTHGGRAWDNGGIVTYGSLRAPTKLGSGGYSQRGGGAMHLYVAGDCVVNGAISANGSGGANAGAGGSVWIEAPAITGTGTISANGGNGTGTSNCGGGGRIAITLSGEGAKVSDFGGTILARSGLYNNKAQSAAGTIYLRDAGVGELDGTLVFDGGAGGYGNLLATEISTSVTDTEIGHVVVTNEGAFCVQKTMRLTIDGDLVSHAVNAAAHGEISDGTLAGGQVAFGDTNRVSHVIGTNVFAELALDLPGKYVQFGADNTSYTRIIAGGILTLAGTEEERVFLRATTEGGQWPLEVVSGASTAISYANVKGSDASYGLKVIADATSVDAGLNENWSFFNIQPGDVISWVGGVSDAWGDPDNWDPARVPVDTDDVRIPSGGEHAPVMSSALTLNKLTVAQGATLTLAGYNLIVTNGLDCAGTLDASAGASEIALGGNVTLMGFACGESVVTLCGGKSQLVTFADGIVLNEFVIAADASFVRGFTATRLTSVATAARDVSFGSGSHVNTTYATLSGGTSQTPLLTLRGSGSWNLSVASKAEVQGVALSNCVAAATLYDEMPGVDLGGNVRWVFGTTSAKWIGGTAGASWDNAYYWSGGVVPDETARVVFDSAATVSVPAAGVRVRMVEIDSNGSTVTFIGAADGAKVSANVLDILNGSTFVQKKCPLAISGDAFVRSGATWTHSENGTAAASWAVDNGYRVDATVGGDMTVEEGGKITAYGKGYHQCYGPGTQSSATYGARWQSGSKSCYGSMFAPEELGSGGTDHALWAGGRIRLFVDGTLTVNGSIDAQGQTSGFYNSSGGSVWLTCGTLAGTGVIQAKGANKSSYYDTGCGGRVAVWQSVATDFGAWKGSEIAAYGGVDANVVGGKPQRPAGTVYLQSAGDGPFGGTVYIRNDLTYVDSGYQSGGVDLPVTRYCSDADKSYHYTTFDLADGGVLFLTRDIEIRDLYLTSASRVNLNGHTLTLNSWYHKKGRKWPSNWKSSIVITGTGGKVIWKPRPLSIIVR